MLEIELAGKASDMDPTRPISASFTALRKGTMNQERCIWLNVGAFQAEVYRCAGVKCGTMTA